MRGFPSSPSIIVLVLALVPACVLAQSSAGDPAPVRDAVRDSEIRATFQRQVPCPSNQRSSGPCPGFEVMHVRPLCSGGSNTVGNLQWQALPPLKPGQPERSAALTALTPPAPCS